MPAKHEAIVQVRLVDGDIPHSTADWTIEPRKLDEGVMAACTLVSGRHKWIVACACNYFDKPFAFKANSFLGLAKPAEYVSCISQEPVESCLEKGVDIMTDMTVQASEPMELETQESQSVSEAATSLRASTFMAMPPAQAVELASAQSAEGQYDHMQCRIYGLPHL